MKLTPKNLQSIANIPNGKIIKKVDDTNFAEVTASDITALGVGGSEIFTLVSGDTFTLAELSNVKTGSVNIALAGPHMSSNDVKRFTIGTSGTIKISLQSLSGTQSFGSAGTNFNVRLFKNSGSGSVLVPPSTSIALGSIGSITFPGFVPTVTLNTIDVPVTVGDIISIKVSAHSIAGFGSVNYSLSGLKATYDKHFIGSSNPSASVVLD